MFSEVLGALKLICSIGKRISVVELARRDRGPKFDEIEVSFNDWKVTVSGDTTKKQGFTASISGELSFSIPQTFRHGTVKKMCNSYKSLLGSTFQDSQTYEVSGDVTGNLGFEGKTGQRFGAIKS